MSFSASAFSEEMDFFLRIPSYVSLQMAGSNQGSRNGSLQAGLNIKNNWMLEMGMDGGSSPSLEENKTLRSRGGHVSLASDPFEFFSMQGSVETWGIEDQVGAVGGRLAGTFVFSKVLISILGGAQQITFKGLPKILWSEGTSTVNDRWLGLVVEVFATRRFSFRASATGHSYDKEMADYAEGVRVKFISPAVLTTAADLNKNEVTLGGNYMMRSWSFGVTLGRTQAALENVNTRSVGIHSGYKLSSRWSFNGALMAYRSENEESEKGANITTILSAICSW